MRRASHSDGDKGFSVVEVLICVFLTALLFFLFAKLAAEVGQMGRANEVRFAESQILSSIERLFGDDVRSALGFSIAGSDRLEISRIDLNRDRGLSLGFPESPPGAWSPYESLERVTWSRQDGALQRFTPALGSSVLLDEVRTVVFSQEPGQLLLEIEIPGAKARQTLTLKGALLCHP